MQSIPQIPTPPTPPTPPGVTTAQSGTQALETIVAQLQAQVTSLEAQRRALLDQVRHGRPEVRGAVAPVLAQVDQQLATTQAQLASAQVELASRQGQMPGRIIINPPYRNQPRQFDPDLAAGLMFAFIFAVLMPISIAVARKIWRSGKTAPAAPRVDDMMGARMDRLEQAVDAIAIEIERISEGQRFITKVMTDRPNTVVSPASAGADAAPRSLGSGPAEPIPVAERQRVKQVVTPH
jgi:hypothetical protein